MTVVLNAVIVQVPHNLRVQTVALRNTFCQIKQEDIVWLTVLHNIMLRQVRIVSLVTGHVKLVMVSQVLIVILVLMDFSCIMDIVGMYVHKKPTQTRIHQFAMHVTRNVSSVLGLQSTTVQVVRLG